MSPTGNRRRYYRPAIAAGAMLVAVAAVVIPAVLPRETDPVAVTTLSLNADRDLGRLPAWSTWSASGDHCWNFGGAGTITDDCGSWDLTAQNSPRTGIITGIPTADATGWVDWTAEQAFSNDGGSDSFQVTGVTIPTATKVSVTLVYSLDEDTDAQYSFGIGGGTTGHTFRVRSYLSGRPRVYIDGPSGSGVFQADGLVLPNTGLHCVTFVYDSAGTNKIHADGVTASLSANSAAAKGDLADSNANLTVAANFNGGTGARGRYARASVSFGTALSLAQHQALCGTYMDPLRSDHAAYSDVTWSGAGGAYCTQTGTGRATCWPGGSAGYTVDATGYHRWLPGDFPGATNRVTYSVAGDCSTLSCATSTIAASVAPDGSKTASSITHGGGTVDWAATGYGASAALYGRAWVKCSSGTLTLAHQGGTGSTAIDCSAVGGAWTLQTLSGWQSTGAGALTVRASGADAEIWGVTFTEEDPGALYPAIVIPTAAAAVTAGPWSWTFANATGTYYEAGDTVTSDVLEASGTCLVLDTTIRLSGAAGSPCVGAWHALEVTR